MNRIWTCFILLLMLPLPGVAGGITLHGAGATFPAPLYEAYFDKYGNDHGQKVLYQAVGSGAGVEALLNRSVDFGATDAYMEDEQLAALDEEVLHLPTCVGAVVLTYNLDIQQPLRLTPELITDIFLGNIRNWDHPEIRRTNATISLPDLEITVLYRYDNSGTTFIFSDYLSKVSDTWRREIGASKHMDLPVGFAAIGNAGISRLIERTPGAIGYVEITYAGNLGLPAASVRNRAGAFVRPESGTVSHAADVQIPGDTRVSITDTHAEDGYPISSFTWLVFYREQAYDDRTLDRALELRNLLLWILGEGQEINATLNYAPLAKNARAKGLEIIRQMTYEGQPLHEYVVEGE